MSLRPEEKKSHMWNVQDPGDPYDIRKSMIARLPEHPAVPMGLHLEVVCLLQSAEIERLSDYLTELRVKFRELEKMKLDRHSYEVQIKELAEKNLQYTGLRSENDRLRQFIRKQTLELEDLQKRSIAAASLETLTAKYENVLSELSMARSQSERAEQTIARLNLEINDWKNRLERADLERATLKGQFELQINQRIALEIRAAREQAEERNSRLQIESRQLRQNLDNKNQEIQLLVGQRQQLSRQVRVLEERLRSMGNLDSTLADKNREIQRLGIALDERSSRLEQAQAASQRFSGQIKLLEEKYFALERERQTLVLRLREAEQQRDRDTFSKYEEKVVMMSMEVERLNSLNANRTNENSELRSQLQRLRIQLQQTQSERQRLKRSLPDPALIASQEQKIALLSQELERCTLQLRTKNQEIQILQQRSALSEASASQLASLTAQRSRLQQQLQASRSELRNYKAVTEAELISLRQEQRRMMQQLHSRKDGDDKVNRENERLRADYTRMKIDNEKLRIEYERLKHEVERYRNESEKVRADIEKTRAENLALKRALEEENGIHSRNTHQIKQLLEQRLHLTEENKKLSADLNLFQRQLAELRATMVKDGEQQRGLILDLRVQLDKQTSRNQQLQSSVESIYRQIDRLHSLLSAKTNDLARIAKENSQLEEKCRFYQNKLGSSATQKEYYQQQIGELKVQLELATRDTAENHRKNQEFNDIRQALESKLAQKERLLAEHLRERQELEAKVVGLQRDLALRASTQDQAEHQHAKALEDIKAKETIILQLQNNLRQVEGRLLDATQRVKRSEGQTADWERKYRDNEAALAAREKEKERQSLEFTRLQAEVSRLSLEVSSSQAKREEEQRQREKLDGLTQQNLRMRMKLDEIERNRNSAEEALRLQLRRAEETIGLQRTDCDSLRQQVRVLQDQRRQTEALREAIKEYQLKIVHIESTNGRLLQERQRQEDGRLQQKQARIAALQRDLNQMQFKFSQFVEKDRSALNSLANYENKISLLSTEFERLNQVVEAKSKECQQKDQIIEQLRRQLSQPPQDTASQNQIRNLRTTIQELESINLHTIAERDELFRVSHELKAEFERNLAQMRDEEKKLRSELQTALEEGKRREQQSRVTQEEHLRRKVQQLEQLTVSYSRQINELTIENTNLQTEARQLEAMLAETKGGRSQEIGFVLAGKDEDLIEWENKYTALYSAYEELYANFNLTKNEYEVTIKNVRVYQEQIFKLEENFSSLSEALGQTRNENQRLTQDNEQLRLQLQEHPDLYQKNILLSKEIDRMTEIQKRMQADLNDTRMRLTDNVSLSKRIEEHLALFVVLFAEIESLRARVVSSEKECEEVRRSSLVPLRVDRSPSRRE